MDTPLEVLILYPWSCSFG